MRKLSKISVKNDKFALCPNCGEGFIDDLLLASSIRCPNKGCYEYGFYVFRGMAADELKERKRVFRLGRV